MTHSISVFSHLDPDIERKRALAKIYSLLIRLAEEKENKKEPSETVKVEEETLVPLKNNIPPAV